MHTHVNKLTNIDSDNGLSPDRCQAIIWANFGILLIKPLGTTNFIEILFEIHTFSFKKIHLKMSLGKWQPFCLSLNVLTHKVNGVKTVKLAILTASKTINMITISIILNHSCRLSSVKTMPHNHGYVHWLKVKGQSLQWCHDEHDGISNHQRLDCLLSCLFKRWSKKSSKLHVTGLCEGNPLVTGGFPSQRASNMENHECILHCYPCPAAQNCWCFTSSFPWFLHHFWEWLHQWR